MDKQKAIQITGTYFPSYPQVQAFHVTADGQVFEDNSHAVNHARSFRKEADQEVITVKRSEWAENKTPGSNTPADNGGAEKGGKTAAAKRAIK